MVKKVWLGTGLDSETSDTVLPKGLRTFRLWFRNCCQPSLVKVEWTLESFRVDWQTGVDNQMKAFRAMLATIMVSGAIVETKVVPGVR